MSCSDLDSTSSGGEIETSSGEIPSELDYRVPLGAGIPSLGLGHDNAGQEYQPRFQLSLPAVHQKQSDNPELQRQEKLKHFEAICSRITSHLYLGSSYVARQQDILRNSRISLVIDLSADPTSLGELPSECRRISYAVEDSPNQHLIPILCLCRLIIDDEVKNGGRVLIHCLQGVSRSASLVIGYLMATWNLSYQDAYSYVKEIRSIITPNFGFLHQLSNEWAQELHRSRMALALAASHGVQSPQRMTRRHSTSRPSTPSQDLSTESPVPRRRSLASSGSVPRAYSPISEQIVPPCPQLYRMAAIARGNANELGPLPVPADASQIDQRSAFIFHDTGQWPYRVYVYYGSRIHSALTEAVRKATSLTLTYLERYFCTTSPPVTLDHEEFIGLLGPGSSTVSELRDVTAEQVWLSQQLNPLPSDSDSPSLPGSSRKLAVYDAGATEWVWLGIYDLDDLTADSAAFMDIGDVGFLWVGQDAPSPEVGAQNFPSLTSRESALISSLGDKAIDLANRGVTIYDSANRTAASAPNFNDPPEQGLAIIRGENDELPLWIEDVVEA